MRHLAARFEHARNIFVEKLGSRCAFQSNISLVAVEKRQVDGNAEAGRDNVAGVSGAREAETNFRKLLQNRGAEPFLLSLIATFKRQQVEPPALDLADALLQWRQCFFPGSLVL